MEIPLSSTKMFDYQSSPSSSVTFPVNFSRGFCLGNENYSQLYVMFVVIMTKLNLIKLTPILVFVVVEKTLGCIFRIFGAKKYGWPAKKL